MHLHFLYLIFFCYFLLISDAKNTFFNPKTDNDSKILIERIKKHVDLEIFTNITEFKDQHDESDDEFVNVCDENKNGSEENCQCTENVLTCRNSNFKNLNIKAFKENFVLQNVWMLHGNALILEKGKIFPENKRTIESLRIQIKKIQRIDDGAFDNLSVLKDLELDVTGLTKIDENVLTEKLGKTLLTFSFNLNDISSLDPSIFKYLYNLRNLKLAGNDKIDGKITNIFPKSLSNLRMLQFGSCKLTHLNEHIFDNLISLKFLDLNNNYFTTIPLAINSLSTLLDFNFGCNLIEKIEKFSFKENPWLQGLSFARTKTLKSVEDCAFCNLLWLNNIDFYQCQNLSYIHENAFGSLSNGVDTKIDEFSIEDCNISVLPERMLNWKAVSKISLNHNPFVCNCSMAWLFKDLNSENSEYENRLSDKYERFHGKSVDKNKKSLGCLGPPPITPNHKHPYTISEIFESCKIETSSNFSWYFIIFTAFVLFAISCGIYYNRKYLEKQYRSLRGSFNYHISNIV